METRLIELERRLARAERRQRALLMLVVTAAVSAFALGIGRNAETQPAGTTVRAPFRVVDDSGRTLLKVAVHPASPSQPGVSELRLYGPSHKPVASLISARQGGTLYLYGANGQPAGVMLGLDERGGYLDTFNQEGNLNAYVGSDRDGGRLILYNSKQVPTAALGADPAAGDAGGGRLSLYDPERRATFSKP